MSVCPTPIRLGQSVYPFVLLVLIFGQWGCKKRDTDDCLPPVYSNVDLEILDPSQSPVCMTQTVQSRRNLTFPTKLTSAHRKKASNSGYARTQQQKSAVEDCQTLNTRQTFIIIQWTCRMSLSCDVSMPSPNAQSSKSKWVYAQHRAPFEDL
ncbi:hypothetical protein CC1G_15113 [Coprinopsis cinerea okayama7|uniref:Uncharacterized protein n=1 Tax=Coprinopsis cinerea (strain Okayama-7 / 130 / ATCC MYA-4618 / FGSC 9003) TaxID=240176 RepID=D6RPH5_COPC7|nr:hypothetical protein CC1G_15113 [Coprinopsis cinerea okayama7\|eukprot:XP_002910472.1 hypothetical protein CC1G_15113 [Coprinopsis cinerea okayama7\